MKETISLLTMAALVILAIEDFRQRMISWYWIPVLLLLFGLNAVQTIPAHELMFDFTINAMFITMQLLMLTLYFSIKEKRFVNIIDTWLGIGDVLLLYVIGIAFSPVNFLLFYTGSVAATIIGYAIYKKAMQGRSSTIPLAGAVALALVLCLCCQEFFWQVSFYDDSPALRLIMR
jgi:hypothetical protein